MLLPSPTPCYPTTSDRPPGLHQGLQVGEQLAGVITIGETVDHRHRRVLGDALDAFVLVGAHHDRIDHPRQDPRGIFDGLAASKLGVAGRQEDRMATETLHPGLERDPRAGG